MSLSACNSAGHLSNHADIAPHYAGVTFAISNTMVSKTYVDFPLVWNVGWSLDINNTCTSLIYDIDGDGVGGGSAG